MPTEVMVRVANAQTEPAVVEVKTAMYPTAARPGQGVAKQLVSTTFESLNALDIMSIAVPVHVPPPGQYQLYVTLSEQTATTESLVDGVYTDHNYDVAPH
jgi:hypothetical protein